jgi:hypothetical protein
MDPDTRVIAEDADIDIATLRFRSDELETLGCSAFSTAIESWRPHAPLLNDRKRDECDTAVGLACVRLATGVLPP